TKQTAVRMLLDAGAIYKNWEKDEEGNWTGEALGATSSGNTFTVEVEQRQPEIDGVKTRIKGVSFVDTHEASIEININELTDENIRRDIRPADRDKSDASYDKVTGRTEIQDDDYLENIAYVGNLSGRDKPVVIILKNALSAEGFEMASEDNNEAVIPITFNAYADFDDAQAGKTAYEIYFPKENEDSGNGGVEG